ncbi:alpha-galactosidase [Aerococcus viridans]
MTSHVSAVPNHQTGHITPFDTRGDVAMSGVLGYELDLTQLSPAEKDLVKTQVATYKEIRPLVQYGDFTRLESPFEGNETAWMFTNEDKSEILVFTFGVLNTAQASIHQVKLH